MAPTRKNRSAWGRGKCAGIARETPFSAHPNMLETSIIRRINIHVSPDKEPLDEALSLLGELMDIRKTKPQHLVVCGGAALRALKIVSRTTRDVDVLASRGEVDGEINFAWPLPEELKATVVEVATELALREDWLNASTSLLVGSLANMPLEIWRDMSEQTYGSRLKISFIGRIGLIFLKLRAAVERDEKRDLDDLLALAPTFTECEKFSGFFEAQQQAKFQEIVSAVSYGK